MVVGSCKPLAGMVTPQASMIVFDLPLSRESVLQAHQPPGDPARIECPDYCAEAEYNGFSVSTGVKSERLPR